MIPIPIYINTLNGCLFTMLIDFVKLDIDFITYITKEKKSYYTFTNLNRKYDNDTYIMKYIGYILINNIEENDIKNDIIGFFYENSKLFYLDELYLCYDLKPCHLIYRLGLDEIHFLIGTMQIL